MEANKQELRQRMLAKLLTMSRNEVESLNRSASPHEGGDKLALFDNVTSDDFIAAIRNVDKLEVHGFAGLPNQQSANGGAEMPKFRSLESGGNPVLSSDLSSIDAKLDVIIDLLRVISGTGPLEIDNSVLNEQNSDGNK